MQATLGTIVQLFQGVHTPTAAHGNGVLLHPSFFTKADEAQRLVPNIEISGKLEKYLLAPGDVLFTAKGWERKAFLYLPSHLPAIPSSAFIVMRMRETDALLPHYLVWFLNHPAMQRRLAAIAKGTSMPALSLQDVATFSIPIPALHTQQSIIRIADLQNRKEHLEASLRLTSQQQLQRQLFNIASLES